MSQKSQVSGLLPLGLSDVLPPFSQEQKACVRIADDIFVENGYEHVEPPLLEFEETLFDDRNTDLARQTFLLTDSFSGKMMGIRSDMTPQIGRIASTRLKNSPRPLRLCYCGAVVRSKTSLLSPERQMTQAGAELIGADTAEADAEIILTAAEALTEMIGQTPCVDLTLPTLFQAICDAGCVLTEDRKKLLEPLNQKDFATVRALWKDFGKKAQAFISVLESLFCAFGPATEVLSLMDTLSFPEEARAEYRRLKKVVSLIKANAPQMEVTIDALENRGFEYHCGVSFAFFSKKTGNELGRGGRYFAGLLGQRGGEPATGVTLFLNTVLRERSKTCLKKKVYVPLNVPFAQVKKLRKEGWIVIRGLRECDAVKEACRLKCDAVYNGEECVLFD